MAEEEREPTVEEFAAISKWLTRLGSEDRKYAAMLWNECGRRGRQHVKSVEDRIEALEEELKRLTRDY